MALETQAPKPARKFSYSAAPTLAPAGSVVPEAVVSLPASLGLNWQWIWMTLAGAGVCAGVLYWNNLVTLVARWASDPGWSHGFVVPLISAFFIRLKWDTIRTLKPEGSLWGLAVLMVGICGQVLFRATGVDHMSGPSLIVVVYGVALFVFGWEFMKILWLPISFLIFSLPPPTTLYSAMTVPMQMIAAELGVQLLPIFGGSGERSGTVLEIWFAQGHTTLGVEAACSGMRMLVAFFALAVALAYSTERPVWQRITLACFAMPVAIICNGFRVALTGVMAVKLGEEWGRGNAHEYLGLVMLGPALVMQIAFAWVLDRIWVDAPAQTAQGSNA